MNKTTSKLTHKSNAAINDKLMAAAREDEPGALFGLGLITLRKNKIGFARIFFEAAAKQGHTIAQKYMLIFSQCSITTWRNYILLEENNNIARFEATDNQNNATNKNMETSISGANAMTIDKTKILGK